MKDIDKTTAQLICELEKANQRLAELEGLETERGKTEKLLGESAGRYRDLYESNMDGVVFTDMKRKFLHFNQAFANMLGFSEEELRVMTYKQLTPRKWHLREQTIIDNQIMTRGYSDLYEKQYIRKDGKTISVYLRVWLRRDAKGKPVGMWAIVRDVTGFLKIDEKLKRSREQLRNLSAHLQSAREEERAIIAREIHDEFGQALTALKMDLCWLQSRFHKEQGLLVHKTEAMLKIVNNTIANVKRMVTELRPAILDDFGLGPAIEWQVGEFQQRTGIDCSVSIRYDNVTLDKRISVALFRISQEALTNVARHAKATRVKISLSKKKGGELVLTIQDNGKGIGKESIHAPESLGITGMRERAIALDGVFNINSITNKRTTVKVIIPVRK